MREVWEARQDLWVAWLWRGRRRGAGWLLTLQACMPGLPMVLIREAGNTGKGAAGKGDSESQVS